MFGVGTWYWGGVHLPAAGLLGVLPQTLPRVLPLETIGEPLTPDLALCPPCDQTLAMLLFIVSY